jgi:hypothetical protein
MHADRRRCAKDLGSPVMPARLVVEERQSYVSAGAASGGATLPCGASG